MACLEMYNSEHKNHGHHQFAPMSPRISFSLDFADAQHAIKHERSSREAPVSSDFEFSVTNYSMMSGADELFSKGRLLPFKDGGGHQMQRSTTTLRDELLNGEEDRDDDVSSSRPPKGSSSARWKGLLGRRKSHNGGGSKKADKSGLGVNEEAQNHVNKASQEVLNEGGSNWRDVEFGI